MSEKKCNLFRYIAGGLLILQGLGIIVSGSFDFGSLLSIFASAVMAISLLTKKDNFFAIGIPAYIVQEILTIIECVRMISVGFLGMNATIIFSILYIVVYVLLFVSLLNIGKNKKLSSIAIAMLLAVNILAGFVNGRSFTSGILSALILAIFSVPIILAVIAIRNTPQRQRVVLNKKSAPVFETSERLTKLKELLDVGAITQEEFDAKKKEILNL